MSLQGENGAISERLAVSEARTGPEAAPTRPPPLPTTGWRGHGVAGLDSAIARMQTHGGDPALLRKLQARISTHATVAA